MPSRRHLPALAAALACLSGAAAAQTSPWYVGLTQTLARDDNVFRRPAGSELSSGTISATQLIGGLDLKPGRQHLFANLHLSHNRYSQQDQLDFNGYGVDAGLDWETVNKLSGTVRLGADKRLGSFNSYLTPTGVGGNIEQKRSLAAEFRLGDYQRSRIWFEADLSHEEQDSEVELGQLQTVVGVPFVTGYDRRFSTTGAGIGLRYRVAGTLVLGVGLHTTRGDDEYMLRQPVGSVVVDDRFDRNDVDFTLGWGVTGASRVNARLSYGKTDADNAQLRADRKGWTGVLQWQWTPTGKIGTTTRLAYETNARTWANQLDTANEPVTTVDLRATYAISAKLSAQAGLSHQSRSLDTGSPDDGSDRIRRANLGIDWAALRNLTLGCAVSLDKRNASTVSSGYDSTTTSCTLRAVLQ